MEFCLRRSTDGLYVRCGYKKARRRKRPRELQKFHKFISINLKDTNDNRLGAKNTRRIEAAVSAGEV